MRRIDSTQNDQLKGWCRLHRRRDRDRLGLCLIEGVRELSRAHAARLEFTDILLGDDAGTSEQELVTAIVEDGARRFALGEAALNKVSVRSNPAQVIGVAKTPDFSLDDLSLSATPLLLVADAIEKPGNLGAMIRSADGAGVDAVIAANPVSDLANPNVIRSSQGALFGFPVARGSAQEIRQWLAIRHIGVVAATAEATTELWDFNFTDPTAIVIGSEHAGLSPEWRAVPQIAIPMGGISDSLNASVAAAVTMYEAIRQRKRQRA